MANVFARLIDNGILSVPLLDVEKNQYIAFIDILDILWYVFRTMATHYAFTYRCNVATSLREETCKVILKP